MVTSHHHFFLYSFAKMIKNPPFTHISWLLPCSGFISGLTVSKWEVLGCFTSQCFTRPPQLFHPHQINECSPPQAGATGARGPWEADAVPGHLVSSEHFVLSAYCSTKEM